MNSSGLDLEPQFIKSVPDVVLLSTNVVCNLSARDDDSVYMLLDGKLAVQ